MANTSVCNDTSEAVELCEGLGLYLKPVAKINICAQLPQLKTPGKTISNWEVMEKIKHMIRPETFLAVKVIKSTMEFIRLEGEIENKSKIPLLTIKLDGKTIKLSGFSESLKVRAAETKVAFPVRHDWDSYFRDAKNMNELRPGERPDTVYFKDLPTRWFAKRSDKDSDSKESKLRPSEDIVRKVFETFGDVRCVDIPMLDPYRKEIMGVLAKPGMIQTFYYGQDIQFDAYVQFKDYISFVKAMDAMRGMKLMYKQDEEKAFTAAIKVEFDKTRHLSDKMIRKRRVEREKLQALEELRKEEERLEREAEEKRKEEERLRKIEADKEKKRKKEEKQELKAQRRKEREEKRRQKKMEKKQKEEEERMRLKIAVEERRLLIAQRKLESLRLLSELFEIVKEEKIKEEVAQREAELEEQRRQEMMAEQRRRLEEEQQKAEAKIQKKLQLQQQEQELREKILKNLLAKEQRDQERQREELRLKLSGSRRLKSAVIMKNTVSSIIEKDSTTDSVINDVQPSSSSPSTDKVEESKTSDKEDNNNDDVDDDEDVEIIEDVPEKDVSVIEILSSSDEEGGGGGKSGGGDGGDGSRVNELSPVKRKNNSAMQRVLQNNKLRAWKERNSPRKPVRSSKPHPPATKRKKLMIVKHVKKRKDSDSDSSDSGDSTITVIPPPRSSFAPPDDPINFMPPPGLMPPPWWGPYPPPPRCMPPWAGHGPPGFRSPPWERRGGRDFRRGAGRNFHTFKEPYLRKYNSSRNSSRDIARDSSRDNSRDSSSRDNSCDSSGDTSASDRKSTSSSKPAPKSIASSISYNLSQKLSKKKDVHGRYMFPLT